MGFECGGFLQGSLGDLGRLLMQGSFSVWEKDKKDKFRDIRFKPMQRHIFLYEKKILFCKKKEDPQNAEKAGYIYKHSLEVCTHLCDYVCKLNPFVADS
jgi:hypothetical protein